MEENIFSQPILNSPYQIPSKHWELDVDGQPTQHILERRRGADFVTPIPKPRKRKSSDKQQEMILDEGEGLSTSEQQYDATGTINLVRGFVDNWRNIPDPNNWKVTPETARLLQHWRHHQFSGIRPFFCQVEAVETLIWLTEVAPNSGKREKEVLERLGDANNACKPRALQNRSKNGDRIRQDNGYGNDHCLANDQLCPSTH